MHRHRKHLKVGWSHFWRQLRKVFKNPIFLVLTLIGNSMLFFCATIFYFIEHGSNPNVRDFGDALWWTFVTMTTAGYGDIVPYTGLGRLIAVFLMLTAGVLFFSFIALLSSAFAQVEFLELEREMRELAQRVDAALSDRKDE